MANPAMASKWRKAEILLRAESKYQRGNVEEGRALLEKLGWGLWL